jgi:hypothetical protein
MTTNTKNLEGIVSTGAVLKRMAKDAGYALYKLAALAVVGNLPETLKHKYYGEDKEFDYETKLATYVSAATNALAAGANAAHTALTGRSLTGNKWIDYGVAGYAVLESAFRATSTADAGRKEHGIRQGAAIGSLPGYLASLAIWPAYGACKGVRNWYQDAKRRILEDAIKAQADRCSEEHCTGTYAEVDAP